MTDGAITNFYMHEPESAGKPAQLVILLHGLGSDGRDLISLAPHFAHTLPQAAFVSPDAPFRCDMAPIGYQWFSLQEWTPESILKGVQTAAPILESFIAAQCEACDVPAEKVALIGFSQGTMMSLYTGLRYPEKLAGVLGYSGALVTEDNTDLESLQKIPVRLIHGEADTVVPVSAYTHARQALEGWGFDVSGYTTPGLMHGIDPAGIESGAAFLEEVLA